MLVPPQKLSGTDAGYLGFYTERSILEPCSQHWACALETIMAARDVAIDPTIWEEETRVSSTKWPSDESLSIACVPGKIKIV